MPCGILCWQRAGWSERHSRGLITCYVNLGKIPPVSGSRLPPLQKGSSGPDPQLSSDSRPCRDPSPGGTAVCLVWEEVWALVFFRSPSGDFSGQPGSGICELDNSNLFFGHVKRLGVYPISQMLSCLIVSGEVGGRGLWAPLGDEDIGSQRV